MLLKKQNVFYYETLNIEKQNIMLNLIWTPTEAVNKYPDLIAVYLSLQLSLPVLFKRNLCIIYPSSSHSGERSVKIIIF